MNPSPRTTSGIGPSRQEPHPPTRHRPVGSDTFFRDAPPTPHHRSRT
ncbi:hypothetical protein AB0M79_28265 [Polymorphospora sp. NPDC051019]